MEGREKYGKGWGGARWLVYQVDGFGSSADRTALDKELEVGWAYQSCSAPRSILGCIHTCRPCRSRARHNAGGKLSDCTLGRSSLPHTDRCLPCKHHVCRSPRNIFLYCQKEESRQEKEWVGVRRSIIKASCICQSEKQSHCKPQVLYTRLISALPSSNRGW